MARIQQTLCSKVNRVIFVLLIVDCASYERLRSRILPLVYRDRVSEYRYSRRVPVVKRSVVKPRGVLNCGHLRARGIPRYARRSQGIRTLFRKYINGFESRYGERSALENSRRFSARYAH